MNVVTLGSYLAFVNTFKPQNVMMFYLVITSCCTDLLCWKVLDYSIGVIILVRCVSLWLGRCSVDMHNVVILMWDVSLINSVGCHLRGVCAKTLSWPTSSTSLGQGASFRPGNLGKLKQNVLRGLSEPPPGPSGQGRWRSPTGTLRSDHVSTGWLLWSSWVWKLSIFCVIGSPTAVMLKSWNVLQWVCLPGWTALPRTDQVFGLKIAAY